MKLSWRGALRLFIFAAALGHGQTGEAMTIALNPPLGPSASTMDLQFSQLNGTAVNGQSLSIDFLFADEKWILANNDSHGVLLMLWTTNIGPTISSELSGTGSFLNHDGKSLVGAMNTYPPGTTNDGGRLVASLYSGATMQQLNPIAGPFVYYGVQYNVTLPSMGSHTITNAQLRFINTQLVSVPDMGSSLATIAVGVLGFAAMRRRRYQA